MSVEKSDKSVCFLCQREAPEENMCSFCHNCYFCCDDHYSAHRGTIKSGKTRKDVCWPFKIESRPLVGNVMIAARDIKATETILEEAPAIWGPNCKSKPICLECLAPYVKPSGQPKKDENGSKDETDKTNGAKGSDSENEQIETKIVNGAKIEERAEKDVGEKEQKIENVESDPKIENVESDPKIANEPAEDSSNVEPKFEKEKTSNGNYRCSKCRFPLCSKKCEDGPNHKSECQILSGWKDLDLDFKADNFVLEIMAVLPIRLLKLSETNPILSERLKLLMDHVSDMGEEELKIWEDFVADTVRVKCKYEKYSKEELLRAIGIIATNAVSQGVLRGQGIYPTFSFISHSCFNNSRFQVYQDRRLVLRAQLDINAGDEVTTLYLPPILGNVRRRSKIKHNWHFECTCTRCSDRTEFGSMLDAVVCQQCKSAGTPTGYLLPENSLDEKSLWLCDHCDYSVGGATISAIMKGLHEEVDSIKEQDPEKIEALILTWSNILHPTHFVMLTLKKRLLDLYRLHPEPENDPGLLRHRLKRQIELGLEQLDIVDKLQPGFSLRRGRILRLLHGPTLRMAKLDLTEGKITTGEFLAQTKIAIGRMKEAIRCMEDFDLFYVASASADLALVEEGAMAGGDD